MEVGGPSRVSTLTALKSDQGQDLKISEISEIRRSQDCVSTQSNIVDILFLFDCDIKLSDFNDFFLIKKNLGEISVRCF